MPFNRSRYPADWEAIRDRIRARAGGRCEWCGAVNYQPHPITGSKVVLTVAHLGTPHAFRHAFAVGWMKRGGDISRLQRTLGHGTAKVTMDYYMTWSDQELSDAHGQYAPTDDEE